MIAGDSRPFGQGPVRHLDRVLALRRLDRASVHGARLMAFLIAWPPLLVLAVGKGWRPDRICTGRCCVDLRAFARYAIAVPLLIIAESLYVPRLCHILPGIRQGGFVRPRIANVLRLGIGHGTRPGKSLDGAGIDCSGVCIDVRAR